MAQALGLKVRKGTVYRVEEVDDVEEGAIAHITTSEESRLRVSVKQVAPKEERLSSRVVDITMCG
jgi:hypothetical protein